MKRTPFFLLFPLVLLWIAFFAVGLGEGGGRDTKLEAIPLWTKGNMPRIPVNTGDAASRYADPPDFLPNMEVYPVREGASVQGAVLISAGGGFQYRSNEKEGYPVAEQLSALGYQCFVVNYRISPYTMQEGALDLARAVRYVRSHAADYGIHEEDIALLGFSAGGMLSGELLLNFAGDVNGTAVDPAYVPDALDQVCADASAVAMVYAFYGELSGALTDMEQFASSNVPPTYFVYGSHEVFRSEIEACADAVARAGVSVQTHILEGFQHGFGTDGNWMEAFAIWLTSIFANQDPSIALP